MLLIIHVGIALSSIIYTAWAFFRPSHFGLNVCYALVAGTLITGTALVFAHPESLPSACVSGLIYLQIVAVGIIFVHRKLRRMQRLVEQKVNDLP